MRSSRKLNSRSIRIVSTVHQSPLMPKSVGEVHPTIHEWPDPRSAIAFLESEQQNNALWQFVRYEIDIRFVNGDKIQGRFQAKDGAIELLKTLR